MSIPIWNLWFILLAQASDCGLGLKSDQQGREMVGTVKHYLEESFWKLKEMGILEWNSYGFSHLITLGKPTEHSLHEGIKKQKISIYKTFLGACPLKARDGHGQCQYVIGFPNYSRNNWMTE